MVVPRRACAGSSRSTRTAEAPNEACGLLALRDGVAERYVPCVNTAASPYRFDLRVPDPALIFELEDDGLRARRLPLAPDRLGEAVADGHREHRPLGGPPYLILSRPTGELLAWTIAAGAAEPLPLD